jgi:pectate lyase
MCVTLLTSLSLIAQGAPLSQSALFSDNFDDGNANGWTVAAGTWSVVQDSGSFVYTMAATGTEGRTMTGSQSWTDYAVEARVKVTNFGGSTRVLVAGRLLDFNNYYAASLLNSGGGTLELRRKVNGSSTTLVSKAFALTTGTWYTVRLEMAGSTLRMFVNGTLQLTASDSSRSSGAIGLIPMKAATMYDNVVVSDGGGATPTATPGGPTATRTRTPTPGGPTPTRTPTPGGGGGSSGLVGYATVNGNTTGGAGGTTTTVSSLSALQSAASSSGSRIIQINTTITGSSGDSVDVTSNKTIIGVGSSGRLVGIQLNISDGASNIIIRNLAISRVVAPGDNIHIQGPNVHHIWIDHNDLSSDTTHDKDFYDGALDISHGADFITVSWNVIHDHFKGSLVGHSDNNSSEDTGKLHVTYHHNYFFNVSSRTPSFRFGTLHSYNNLFENFFDASTGISSRMGACARIENNVFTGVSGPILTTQSGTGSDAGAVQLIGNSFGGGTVETSPTCSLTPPYSFTAESAGTVSATVKANAGVGKVN